MRHYTIPSLVISFLVVTDERLLSSNNGIKVHAQTVPSTGAASAAGMEFIGPSVCSSDGTTIGYDNTTTLFYDSLLTTTEILEGKAAPEPTYEFVLCPSTTFDLGLELEFNDPNARQNMVGLIPLLDNSHYKCGDDGALSNRCILSGGWYHILFEDDIPLVNITFSGLTFEKSLDSSVMAYGQPGNDAVFINCRWKNNKQGSFLIDNFWHLYLQGGIIEPGGTRAGGGGRRHNYRRREMERELEFDAWDVHSLLTRRGNIPKIRNERHRYLQIVGGDYPSMYLGFAGCHFTENELGVALISNDGGFLDLTKCRFENNKAAVIIANVLSARLAMYGATTFRNNDDMIGPVFLDSTSTLLFHEKTTGENNIGSNNVVQCEGIFMESPGADCLNNPEECYGSCCEWGDASCDLVEEDPTAPSPSPGGAVIPTRGTVRPSSPPEDGCNATCKTFAVILPLLGLATVVASIMYLRKQRRLAEEEEDDQSMQPADHDMS